MCHSCDLQNHIPRLHFLPEISKVDTSSSLMDRCNQFSQNSPPLGKLVVLSYISWYQSWRSCVRVPKVHSGGGFFLGEETSNGVRGLMLDMYEFNNDIWLCHGLCSNATAFEPALITLKEIQTFMEGNPTEIITIIIEDYVTTPFGLTKVFDAAALRNYWFPVTRMPKNVFTSRPEKETIEGIAYQWNYMVENQSPLLQMVDTCHQAAGKRWPNYIALDFHTSSHGEGAPGTIDAVNGRLVCGCPNITYCKGNKRSQCG
ncbi:hypothetical protein UlMin_043356 [Ulmus minor]